MKTEYNLKDKVWIHIGEQNLVSGRVVDIFDLVHLNEGHSPGRELYVIEIKTGIDDVYEVRDFEQISPDANGPINLFRRDPQSIKTANRMLKKIGIKLPHVSNTDSSVDFPDEEEPTPEQIHAAMERATIKDTIFNPNARPGKKPTKKRTFTKRKTNGNNTEKPSL
jgi:hypothetical protein